MKFLWYEDIISDLPKIIKEIATFTDKEVFEYNFMVNYVFLLPWTMDMWCEHFSKMFQIIGWFGQMGPINCGVFGVFPVELFAHILSLFVLSPWFSNNQPSFLQKTKILRHFKVCTLKCLKILVFVEMMVDYWKIMD